MRGIGGEYELKFSAGPTRYQKGGEGVLQREFPNIAKKRDFEETFNFEAYSKRLLNWDLWGSF